MRLTERGRMLRDGFALALLGAGIGYWLAACLVWGGR